MDSRLKSALRWLLVLMALCASSFIAFILGMGWMLWPDRSVVAALSAFEIAPRGIIEVTHRLDFFVTILIWVVPPTCAIGFAARTSQRRALRLAVSLSLLLFAPLCYLLGRQNRSIGAEFVSAIAAVLVLAALAASFSKRNFPRIVTAANVVAILLLFSPSLVALTRRTDAPPEAKALWSITIQQQDWFQQSMNTGSEYAATRLITFAADRVVLIFDAGYAPYQGKQPMSNFRIVSLDAKTGTKKNEISFVGRWGGAPYIYATSAGEIHVQSSPSRTLNPDLTTAADSNRASSVNSAPIQSQEPCPNCNPPQYPLPKNQVLELLPKHFRVRRSSGQPPIEGNLVEWGNYAGASADGRRFAIQSSYTEGDPDFVVYEYFTIYDVVTGKALATIHMKELPERQSWSAFSPDGRYFVAGNPNKLTMYLLP